MVVVAVVATYGEELLGFLGGHAAELDQGPESGVVEVVDVAVDLAPAHVVAEVLDGGVADGAAVEGGE